MDRQKGLYTSRINKLFLINHSYAYGGDLDDIIEYNDLTIVLKGKLRYIVDGVKTDICENTAVLFSRGNHRVRVASESSDVEYISFNFIADSQFSFPERIENCVTKDVLSLLKLLKNAYLGHSLHREGILLMMFQTLLFTLDDIILKNEQNPHIEKILSYIDKHYTEKVTLENISEAVHLAPSYCSNLIKKELGITISEIVAVKRMELARNLMLQKNKTMIEIAHLCGYNHYGYFLKCFKRTYGYTPSDML